MSESVFDIVVVGSGGGGCAAAVTAAGHNLSVCLLEKGERPGGATATSYGSLWVGNNSLAREAGLDDSLASSLDYARFVAGGTALDENLDAYVREGARAVDALRGWGVRLQLLKNLPEHYFPHAPGSQPDGRRTLEPVPIDRNELGPFADAFKPSRYIPQGVNWSEAVAWGGFANKQNWNKQDIDARLAKRLLGAGQGLIGQFIAALLKLGGEVRTRAAVESLVTSGTRVTGVRLRDGTTIRARCGVILATGGYEGNPELVKRFEGIPDWINPLAPTNEGDGLLMATEIGAAIYRTPVNHSMLVGCAIPGAADEFFSLSLHGLPYPGAIAVNDRGERFCDESSFQDVVKSLQIFERESHRFVNLPAFMIFDDQFRQRYSVAGGVPGAAVPEWVARADTLKHLATKLGIDPDGLQRHVEEFNRNAALGRDPAFGRGASAFSRDTAGDAARKNPQLGEIASPPYYALKLKLGGARCSAGILTDAHGAVRHVRGHAIPSLYACGNAAAPADTGVGYQAGASVGSGIVFGFLAAEHAASLSPLDP